MLVQLVLKWPKKDNLKMKKEIVAFLKQNIGMSAASHIAGFGGWLGGVLKKVSDEGDIELDFEVRNEMLNPLGTIHGGAMASILDEVMGMQLYLKSGEEDTFFAINIVVDFVKNAKESEILTAKPELIRIGRKTANLRCTIYNSEGTVVAHGSSNFLKISR